MIGERERKRLVPDVEKEKVSKHSSLIIVSQTGRVESSENDQIGSLLLPTQLVSNLCVFIDRS